MLHLSIRSLRTLRVKFSQVLIRVINAGSAGITVKHLTRSSLYFLTTSPISDGVQGRPFFRTARVFGGFPPLTGFIVFPPELSSKNSQMYRRRDSLLFPGWLRYFVSFRIRVAIFGVQRAIHMSMVYGAGNGQKMFGTITARAWIIPGAGSVGHLRRT